MAQQPLASSVQPTDIYGGDEISALVLDPGYCSTRAGFAGEDVPKCVLPSYYGHVGGSGGNGRDVFGDECIVPRAGFEIRNYMSRDSTVEDWDSATRMWEHMLVRRLQPERPTRPSQNGLNDPEDDDDEDGDDGNGSGNGNSNGHGNGHGRSHRHGSNGHGSNGHGGNGHGSDSDGDGDVKMEDLDAEEDTMEKPLSENPLLLTEAPWNSAKARERAIEVIMENWACPAFWLSRTPVLAAFAAGKASALVIDVGGANTSVTAVHDGMVLKRSIQRSHVGGLWLSSQIRSMWEGNDPRIDVVPTFMVENKKPVEALAPPDVRLRNFSFPIHETFRAYEEERLVTEFKESVVEVWRGPGRYSTPPNEEFAKSQPGRVFEMPDGSNQMWREQRYRVAEGMWDETAAYQVQQSGNSDPDTTRLTKGHTLPELIRAAVNGVDVDLRPNLLGNVVVTGATSLLNGFNDRLNNELAAMWPGLKIKIHAAGLTSERRFGAWIGGSILASLGTFHQMWISRKEYEENGVSIVEKRCK